jgi:HPt (histidine-containing phosphotransfer) domain-containing protein
MTLRTEMTKTATCGSICTVTYRPGSTWSQGDLGGAFDFEAISIIGDLDPSGANGLLEEVLSVFLESLEPMLVAVEWHRAAGSVAGIRFEAHKLKSSASQVGALRLSDACAEVMRRFGGDESANTAYKKRSGPLGAELDLLVDNLISEAIRVQRKLRRLLTQSAN